MSTAPLFRLDDETGRIAALRRYEILDSAPEKEFDEIVALVRSIFNTPYASINLIDVDREWHKASAGKPAGQIERKDAFCNQTIQGATTMVVNDALDDARFAQNRYVTGAPGVRSYLGTPLTSPDGYNIGALCVFDTQPRSFSAADEAVIQNFAKVVMSQLELRLIAHQDSLTGSLTRRAFIERMEQAMASGLPASLLLFDLDHFKSVNDTYGHPAGDKVLQAVALAAAAGLRRGDAFGRMGGEEFAILLPGTPAEGAVALAERLRAAVAENSMAEVNHTPVTLSFGIAEYKPEEGRDAWLKRADQALYQAKNGGRNRCILAPTG